MRNGNKGQIRIIEAFLAVLIIFSSFAMSSSVPVPKTASKGDDLVSIGLQVLTIMDQDGSLSDAVLNKNWTTLRESLELALPAGIIFHIKVYDGEMEQINGFPISNGAFGGGEISFVEYVLVPRNESFSYFILHLELGVAT